MTLRDRIEQVLKQDSPGLGLHDAEAAELLDAIAEANLGDPAALRAYDLLHQRVTYGRAW
jgi:hypothetical protein